MLYFAQFTDEEIRDVNKDKTLWLKLQECIRNHNTLNFKRIFYYSKKKYLNFCFSLFCQSHPLYELYRLHQATHPSGPQLIREAYLFDFQGDE